MKLQKKDYERIKIQHEQAIKCCDQVLAYINDKLSKLAQKKGKKNVKNKTKIA